MQCPYCGNEMGNGDICSYCGHRVYQTAGQHTYYTSIDRTVPVTLEVMEEDSDIERHAANCDTWGLMTVILLAGIFILDLLRLLMMFV